MERKVFSKTRTHLKLLLFLLVFFNTSAKELRVLVGGFLAHLHARKRCRIAGNKRTKDTQAKDDRSARHGRVRQSQSKLNCECGKVEVVEMKGTRT